ncbi:hypothetical protein [Caminibacter pacificus]|uniref:Uncharacterized protein n=1 Tax=Caminibacter pacificus TaxID=1424653 RepID=A0AAJ4UX67_9BACT|nr:hypothetical protein [Caminibacter pacificus]QDD68127.1 hypothetical protein C6V80_09750 [Caminibacter pacificus]ROR38745.1 hypothetical protein EDC58_1960 [Caminibacter pacificus]
MGYKEYQEEVKLRNRDLSFQKWINFFAFLIAIFFLYVIFTGANEDFFNFIFLPLNVVFLKYPAFFAFAVYLILFTKGYLFGWSDKFAIGEYIRPLPIPFFLKAPLLIPFQSHKYSRLGFFKDWAFQAPKKSDELPRRGNHKVFIKDSKIETFFDIDNDGGTDKIISMFRYELTKEMKELLKKIEKLKEKGEDYSKIQEKFEQLKKDEQFKKYKDLFDIIEGTFKQYEKVLAHEATSSKAKLSVTKKQKPTELVYKYLQTPVIRKKTEKIFFDFSKTPDVYDYKRGRLYFSAKQIKEIVSNVTIVYMKYVKTQLERNTRIRKKYGGYITPERLERYSLYFRFVYFRQLMKLWLNLPAGWYSVRVEDYTLRRIISTIDRNLVINITKANSGESEIFEDDKPASAFLFTYYAFFQKSAVRYDLSLIEYLLTPDKTINEADIIQSTIEEKGKSKK